METLAISVFGQGEYQDLKSFFQIPKTQSSGTQKNYAYVVYMARRCFNLYDAYSKIQSDGTNKSSPSVLSNTGFLLKTYDLAKAYVANRRFPNILIHDDIMFYGTSVYDLLFHAEELIEEYVSEIEKRTLYISDHIEIRRALVEAVDIRVWAKNQEHILLPKDYLPKLKSTHTCDSGELRKRSLRISTFLKRSCVPNTSYVISYEPSSIKQAYKGWERQNWKYRGTEKEFFLKAYNNKMLATLRLHIMPEEVSEKALPMRITALALWDNLPYESFDRICQRVAEILSSFCHINNSFLSILRDEKPRLQEARAQALSLIISMDIVRSFESSVKHLGEEAVEKLIDSCDAEKISRNFGVLPDDVSQLFAGILSSTTSIWELIENDFPENGFLENTSVMDTHGELVCAPINMAAEDYFYFRGMEVEQAAYELRQNGKTYYPTQQKKGIKTLSSYTETMKLVNLVKPFSPKQSIIPSVLSLLLLMDDGSVSMKIQSSGTESDLQYILKAGEISKYLWPRRFFYFIPALALVEQNYWPKYTDKGDALKHFIRTLVCDPQRVSEALLDNLKANADKFVQLVYGCGQSFTGWDVELRTSEDRYEQMGGTDKSLSTYVANVIRDCNIQDMYKKQAHIFVSLD